MSNKSNINKQAKYTFIIPVYNVEEYLNQCVNSILTQTYKNYNIILIDDGSTDGSSQICDNFSNEHSNITTLHQQNGGASVARNAGLKIANTPYIIFIDSDDFWKESCALEKFDKILKKYEPDILCFNSYMLNEGDKNYIKTRYNYSLSLNGQEPLKSLQYQISNNIFSISPWAKIIKTKFLTENNLFFIEGLKAEDIEWGMRFLQCLPKYAFSPERAYVYRNREGSCTHTIDKKHIEDYLWIVDTYSSKKYNSETRDLALSYLAYQYILLMAHVGNIKLNDKKNYTSQLKKMNWLLEYNINPRVKKIYRIYKIFGFNLTKILLSIYLKQK